MPTISMFYGIVVYMYLMDNKQHHLPHIHTRYQGLNASIAIEDGSVLDGQIPQNKLRLVQAWIESIVKNCWRIGSLPSLASRPTKSIRSSEEQAVLLNVIHVEPKSDYTLLVEFENHEQRFFDVTPYLEIGVFRRLRDMSLFRAAFIDGGTVAWPGEIDIAPETLYIESRPA